MQEIEFTLHVIYEVELSNNSYSPKIFPLLKMLSLQFLFSF